MHSVWAVARNTIAQALRMKVAAVVIILLLVMLPLMSNIMDGDGTLQGKLQTFVSYGLSLMTLLLCVLTIAISTFTLTNDIKRKYIFLVITKPLNRFQIVFGKLLGVVIVNVVLLTLFSAVIYGLTLLIPRLAHAEPREVFQARNEFFTARTSLTDPIDEEKVEELALARLHKLKEKGQLPENMTELSVLAEFRKQEKLNAKSVEVGHSRKWEFHDVRPRDPNDMLFVRFKYNVSITPPDEKVYGYWEIGDFRQLELGTGQWKTPLARVMRSDVTRTFVEIEVPSSVIADDNYVAVVFRNTNRNQTTVIPEEVELLYRIDTFTSNYIRVVILIFVRLVYLAALGISVSTWLSFPVAFLITIVVFCIGMINGFIMESLDLFGPVGTIIVTFTLKPLIWMLPVLDGEYNPTQFVVFGRYLTWQFLATVYRDSIGIKALILTLFGIWIFSNREIAKAVT